MAETLDPEKLQEYRDIFSFFDRSLLIRCGHMTASGCYIKKKKSIVTTAVDFNLFMEEAATFMCLCHSLLCTKMKMETSMFLQGWRGKYW